MSMVDQIGVAGVEPPSMVVSECLLDLSAEGESERVLDSTKEDKMEQLLGLDAEGLR